MKYNIWDINNNKKKILYKNNNVEKVFVKIRRKSPAFLTYLHTGKQCKHNKTKTVKRETIL